MKALLLSVVTNPKVRATFVAFVLALMAALGYGFTAETPAQLPSIVAP